ncbi:MAG: GNAT family protein [Steroidobacteraceae bacterium]
MLEGSLVRLAALDPDRDISDAYVAWLNDPEVFRYLGSKFPQSTVSVRHYLTGIVPPNFIARILRRDTGAHIGNIAMQFHDPVHRNIELGILIGDRAARGKGYGREACRLAIEYTFEHLNVHRITSGTISSNLGMQKVFAALGFTLEGTLRQHYALDGKRLDALRYGLLREEFASRKP